MPRGAGAILTFGVKGGAAAAKVVIDSLQLFSQLANVGDAKSLVIHPATTTHQQLTVVEQIESGVTEDMVRLSVGIEDVRDIIADLEHGLDAAREAQYPPRRPGRPESLSLLTTSRPIVERDVAIGPLRLDCGVTLDDAVQRVSVYGEPAADGANVVVVCARPLTRIEPRRRLVGRPRRLQWEGARSRATSRSSAVNAIGGCYGSTGPASLAADGHPYGSRFPLVTVSDIVRAQATRLSRRSAYERIHAAGRRYRLGAGKRYAWAALRPLAVNAVAVVGAYDYFSAMGIALNAVAREAIRNDPAFAGGDYYGGDGPRRGVELARKIAMLTYKSDALFHRRFERKVDRGGGDPYANAADRFDVEGYLDHQGTIFSKRMDPNAYLALTRAMDLFDLRAHAPPPDGAHVTFVGISSDWLFPPSYVRETAERIARAGARSTYAELHSDHGHDAFLAEPEALAALLAPVFG